MNDLHAGKEEPLPMARLLAITALLSITAALIEILTGELIVAALCLGVIIVGLAYPVRREVYAQAGVIYFKRKNHALALSLSALAGLGTGATVIGLCVLASQDATTTSGRFLQHCSGVTVSYFIEITSFAIAFFLLAPLTYVAINWFRIRLHSQ
jgi:hypothetical protein